MELRLLRSFCILAEEEHFNRAAQRLNLAQPSLTAQIKQLEAELGEKLFERHSRQVSLTDAGHLLWEHAEKVLQEAGRAKQAMQELKGLERGRVRVGVVQTVKTCLAPEVVSNFISRYPGIAVDLSELSADDIESSVSSGKIDCGISFGPPRDSKLKWEALFEEELVAVVPQDHEWVKRRFIRFEEFAQQPLALLSQGFCTRRVFDTHAKATGITPRVIYETNSIESILLTLPPLQAVSFLPNLVARLPALSSNLRAIKIKLARPEPITRKVAILRSEQYGTSRAAAAFIDQWRILAKKL